MGVNARQMALGLFVLGQGHNVGSWRAPASEPGDLLGLDYYREVAQSAERGKFDMIFFAEILYAYEQAGRPCGQLAFPTLDPMALIGALAGVTSQIGLTGTYSTTFTDPYVTAAKLATLDRLSAGRVGWNIVTTGADLSAGNFSPRVLPEREERYARALDYVRYVETLWDAWPRSQQGSPVRVQAGMSPHGRAFAAKVAEVLFTVSKSPEEGRAFRDDLRGLVAAEGRDPDQVKVMPGIAPILADTEAAAKAKEEAFAELVHPRIAMALLSDQFGLDFSTYDLDAPLPLDDIKQSPRVLSGHRDPSRLIEQVQGRLPTLREYLRQSARVRAHQSFVGTPEQLADRLEAWFTAGACDGFNIMPPVIRGEVDILVDELVPILRKRGLFRTDYPGSTLRETLGLGPGS